MPFNLLAGLLTTAVINGVLAVPMMVRQLFQRHQKVNRVLPRDWCKSNSDGHMAANQTLCCTRKRNLPAGKYEHGRMALEGTSKNLCALDT